MYALISCLCSFAFSLGASHSAPVIEAGAVGRNWAVMAADLGPSRATLACDRRECEGRRDHPRGVWASWEPKRGPLFAQIGVGIYTPGTDQSIELGPLLGLGARWQNVDAVLSGRYIKADAQGVDHSDITLTVRVNI